MSPESRVRVRWVSSVPDVGFCAGGGASTSSIVRFTLARNGVPSGWNIVYVTVTAVRIAVKLMTEPQPNST